MTKLQDRIVETAKRLGVAAQVWEKGDRARIYAQDTRRDIQVYLDFPDGFAGGAAFKAFCSTQQHPNWVRAQAARAREDFIALWHAYVFENYRETGPQPNGYGCDINGMIDESRAYIAAALSEGE